MRSDDQLSLGERAADRARDVVGTWTCVALVMALVAGGIVLAVRHDPDAGPVALLGLVMSGLALVGLTLVLMAAPRADRRAAELAVFDLESDRRRAAGVDDVRDEVQWLRADLARLAARLETSPERGRRGDA